jgi:hypothetical protein
MFTLSEALVILSAGIFLYYRPLMRQERTPNLSMQRGNGKPLLERNILKKEDPKYFHQRK